MFKINFSRKDGPKPFVGVGLDINVRYAKVAEVASGDEAKLLKYGIVRFDPKAGRQAKVAAIQGVINNAGIRTEYVNIAVSGQQVIVRYLEFPRMRKEEMMKAVSFEMDKYVPFRQEDIYYDIFLQEAAPAKEGKIKALLAVAKKDVVHEYVELLKDAGFGVGLVDVKPFSLLNSFQVAGPQVSAGDVTAIINIDSDIVVMDILTEGRASFSRDIAAGKIDLAGIISNADTLEPEHKQEGLEDARAELTENLDNLVKEMRGSLGYFESQSQKQVNKVYIAGEAALKQRLVDMLGRELGLEMNIWNPLKFLQLDGALSDKKGLDEEGHLLSFAIGLAARRQY